MSIDPDMIHKDKRDLELADGLYGQLRCNHNVTKFESKILSICSLFKFIQDRIFVGSLDSKQSHAENFLFRP